MSKSNSGSQVAASTSARATGRNPQSRDWVTILAASPGKLATKRFKKTVTGIEKKDYDAGYWYGVLEPWIVHDIFELSDLLSALEGLPNLLVIRGAPRDPAYIGTEVRRLGSGGEGNFQTPQKGRFWAQLDFDKIDVPGHLSLIGDPISVCEHLIARLPAEFHGASYHWSLSSSAGMGDPSKVSLHLWFWFAKPVPDGALKDWGKAVNDKAGLKLIDTALFQHVQAHYTAAPIFDGLPDPVPTRSGLVTKNRATVRLLLPKAASRPRGHIVPLGSPLNGNVSGGSGFEHYLSMIGDHAGGNGFHGAIVSAAASYVATHGALGTDVDVLYELIRARVLAADSANHDRGYIEKMAGREHIISAIQSAIDKFGDATEKFGDAPRRRKTRLHEGVEPYYPTAKMTVAEAQRRLIELAAG